jgi:hypothetical protein
VSTAELCVRLALDAREEAIRKRQLQIAWKAYGVAGRFLPRTDFRDSKRRDFDKRLAHLERQLEHLDDNGF